MEVLGIDVGGTGIKGAPVDIETGKLTAERIRLKTPKGAKPKPVAEVVAEIIRHFEWKGPVGLGFPAPIKSGVVKMAANIAPGWVGLNANELFSAATGCPCTVANDADVAGLAEMSFGAGKNHPGTVIMITLGTGIGSAIFYNGHMLPNSEFGHLEMKGQDAEWRASDAARKREKLSWKKYGRRLDRYLKAMEKLFWPDMFIIGGGISKEYEKFMPFVDIEAQIVPAEFLNEAGIVGAALVTQGLVTRVRKEK